MGSPIAKVITIVVGQDGLARESSLTPTGSASGGDGRPLHEVAAHLSRDLDLLVEYAVSRGVEYGEDMHGAVARGLARGEALLAEDAEFCEESDEADNG